MFKSAGMGVIDAVGTFMQGMVVDLFGGTLINLVHGRFADAWDSAVNGLDKMIFGTTRRFFNGMLEGAGHFFKTATYWLPAKAGGEFLRGVIDRGVDSFRSVGNGILDIARNTWRLPFEIGVGFLQDMGGALKYFARGDFGEGAERFGMAFVHPFERAGGYVVDNVMVGAQAISNVAGNVSGQAEPSRGLSKAERADLKSIYGDSINLEDIRIHREDLSNQAGINPHTVGNDIYLPQDCFNPDGTLNTKGRITLAHEAFHVYQAQHGGNDYIHKALESHVGGIAESGSINSAYDWTGPLRAGTPFSEWNPEQQAAFMDTLANAKYNFDANGNGQIELAEFQGAASDNNDNGRRDGPPPMSPPGTPDREPLVNLSADDLQRAMAIWNAIKDDRPDRTVL
jgi:hypothetical protein